jgi:hypothetical protein
MAVFLAHVRAGSGRRFHTFRFVGNDRKMASDADLHQEIAFVLQSQTNSSDIHCALFVPFCMTQMIDRRMQRAHLRCASDGREILVFFDDGERAVASAIGAIRPRDGARGNSDSIDLIGFLGTGAKPSAISSFPDELDTVFVRSHFGSRWRICS